jgi:hypothetical protein
MEAMLLAAALSCADGAWILAGIAETPLVSETERSELRVEIIQVMPDNCSFEEYNPTGRK